MPIIKDVKIMMFLCCAMKSKEKNTSNRQKESYMHMWKCIHYCQKIASMWSDKSRGVTRVELPCNNKVMAI